MRFLGVILIIVCKCNISECVEEYLTNSYDQYEDVTSTTETQSDNSNSYCTANLTNLKIVPNQHSEELSVTWELHTLDECDFEYRVTAVDVSHPNTHMQSPNINTTIYLIKDIKPCTTYNITVELLLSGNEQVLASLSDKWELDTIVLDQVEKLNVTTTTNAIRLSWTPHKYAHICNIRYVITAMSASPKREIPYFRYVNRTDHWIKNLHSCTWYNVSVTPSSIHRTELDDQTPHLMHVVSTLPEKIRHLALDNGGSNISWLPPDNQECIQQYRITSDKLNTTTANTYLKSSLNFYCTIIEVTPVIRDAREGQSVRMLKPGPVLNLTSSSTDTTITVTWEKPEDDTCVIDFSIQLISSSETIITRNTNLCLDTFENLTPCTEYDIKVAAISFDEIIGMTLGDYTSITTKTLQPDDIGPVENLDVPDNDTLIWWEPPSNAKMCNSTYIVQVLDNQNEEVYKEETPEHSHSINLGSWFIGCMPYTISVIASLGLARSAPVQRPQMFQDVPKPPGCKVEDVGKNWAVLECEPDNYATSMCEIHEFVVYCEATVHDNQGAWVIWNGTATKNYTDNTARLPVQIKVENISPFTNYTCRGVVHTSAGRSNLSAPVEFQTHEEVPDAPTLEQITQSSDTSFDIKWTPPENLRGILRGYKITIESLGPQYYIPGKCLAQGNKTYTFKIDPVNEHTFTEAFPGYTYEVHIQAATSEVGPPSEKRQIQTKEAAPKEAPTYVNFTLNKAEREGYNESVRITWRFPCNTNGRVKHFEIKLVGKSYADADLQEHKQKDTVPIHEPIEDLDYDYTFIDLQPAFNYTISIKIVGVNKDLFSRDVNLTFLSHERRPQAPILKQISQVTEHTFALEWEKLPRKNGLIQNYRVEVTDEGPQYWKPNDSKCYKDKFNSNLTILPEKTTLMFKNVSPYNRYKTIIYASTKAGYGPPSKELITETSVSEPETVRDRNIALTDLENHDYTVNATLTFKYPCNTYGIFKQIRVTFVGNRPNTTPHKEEFNITTRQEEYNLSIRVRPAHDYTVAVQVETETHKSNISVVRFSSPPGVPPPVTATVNAPVPHEPTLAKYVLPPNLFDETNGKIMYYALILGETGYEEASTYGFWNGDDETWPSVGKYFIKSDRIQSYQATPKYWNPFQDDSNPYTFIIGNTSYSEFNKPLQQGITYAFKVRGFTQTGYRDSPTVTFKMPVLAKLGLILGLLFGLLGTGILLGSVFILRRKRQQWEKERESIKSIPLTPMPVTIKQFPDYYDELKNNNNKLKYEFTLLSTSSSEVMLPGYEGLLPENKKKNRYTNIIPFDQTRVKLIDTNDNCSTSDYINASYIQGYSDIMEYIATQGPLEHTCQDFWRMVIQENSSLIIMVAQFVEGNKEKCYKYFPNNHENMELENGIAVRCCSELDFKDHIVRTLLVQKDLQQWTITHVQFTDWPDFGCPIGTDVVLEFCQIMREHAEKNPDPIIIHCSAGVGRTGTLIALDILLQAINRKQDIDIFGTVLNLRRDRKNMVQTEKQYLYIHSCISAAIENPQAIQYNISRTDPIYENLEEIKKHDDDIEESKF